MDFQLHPKLAADTVPVTRLSLCELRLMNDSRWPWLILVPQRDNLIELHELTPLDQTMLTFESTLVSKALKAATGADKLNVGALGNVVPMLHLHIVARRMGDTGWPSPVWGHGEPVPYAADDAEGFAEKLRRQLLPH